jgi:hypothetical protein
MADEERLVRRLEGRLDAMTAGPPALGVAGLAMLGSHVADAPFWLTAAVGLVVFVGVAELVVVSLHRRK